MSYIVICQQVIGGSGQPFEIHYGWDGEEFRTRKAAIRHGLKIRESDDFNIGVLKGEHLEAFDWMDEPVETDPNMLAKIGDKIFCRG